MKNFIRRMFKETNIVNALRLTEAILPVPENLKEQEKEIRREARWECVKMTLKRDGLDDEFAFAAFEKAKNEILDAIEREVN